MRASDSERQAVVEVLKVALDDGRLKMDEYVERMEKAYEATTVGDLALLHDDLPGVVVPVKRPAAAEGAPVGAAPFVAPAPVGPPPVPATGIRGAYSELPAGLKVLWTIWFAAVSINVVVWVLLGLTSMSIPYPWPLWVAGPAGAALFGISAPTLQAKRARQAKRRGLPPKN
ncbi:DUF1707 domain-containing protein [Catenulispora subtropica]|uniref:DUF1707 domain-containing protein n=2 Tax=Catenulispora subtropica TaxID=450798 RepID=A0ABP5D6C9_9ACTN